MQNQKSTSKCYSPEVTPGRCERSEESLILSSTYSWIFSTTNSNSKPLKFRIGFLEPIRLPADKDLVARRISTFAALHLIRHGTPYAFTISDRGQRWQGGGIDFRQ